MEDIKVYCRNIYVRRCRHLLFIELSLWKLKPPVDSDRPAPGGTEKTKNKAKMGRNSLLFHPYGQLLLLMYDVKANKNSWTDSYSGIPNKYGDFIVVAVAIEVEDQNAIKIDDYGENIRSPPFSSARPAVVARQD